MSTQRSILSFFQSSPGTTPSSTQPPPSASIRPLAPKPPPPPPPPPPASRFVPPPSAAASATKPPPGMVTRSGGSPDPKLDLLPITAAEATDILMAAGATPVGADLVFALPPSSSSTVRIAMPRDSHVPDLVSVNAILLSVRYPDAFYRPVADRTRVASLFNRVLFQGDKVVGGLVCRLEPSPFEGDDTASTNSLRSSSTPLVVYIQSLALLSPHRGRGLAAAALESLAATATALNATGRLPPVRALYAHVWTESAEALHWYEARGFVRHGGVPVDNYYYALRPGTAWLMRRDLPLPAPPAPRPSRPQATSSLSFQNARPETEWNDLPADMMSVSATPSTAASGSASAASSRNVSRSTSRLNLPADDDLPPAGAPPTGSRSTSTVRKKRDRAYPAAMFGQ